MSLIDAAADWVTVRDVTPEGQPIVVLLDRAVVAGAPWEGFPTQVAVAVLLAATPDGLPSAEEQPRLKALEQSLVDAATGQARLVGVMTLEGVREWIFYGRSTDWTGPYREAGISVVVTDDPSYGGLLELAGAPG
jgi:hypothetical protein